VPGRVGGVAPLVEDALDVGRGGGGGTFQCHHFVAERAGGVGDGVAGAAEEALGIGWWADKLRYSFLFKTRKGGASISR
jgi:hypothetical protein